MKFTVILLGWRIWHTTEQWRGIISRGELYLSFFLSFFLIHRTQATHMGLWKFQFLLFFVCFYNRIWQYHTKLLLYFVCNDSHVCLTKSTPCFSFLHMQVLQCLVFAEDFAYWTKYMNTWQVLRYTCNA